MNNNTKIYFNLSIAIIIALGIAANGFFIAQAIIQFKNSDRSIVVKGLSEREVKSDLAELILTFKNIGNNLTEIHYKNDEDKKIIIELLKSNNFKDEEIALDGVELFDRQAIEYSYNDKTQLAPRYVVTSHIKINTTNVDLVKNLVNQMDQLMKQQINISANTRYYFTKFDDLRGEMIAEATKSARQAANQFAKDSESKVGEIKHAIQGAFKITSPNEEYNEVGSLYKKIRVVTTITFNILS